VSAPGLRSLAPLLALAVLTVVVATLCRSHAEPEASPVPEAPADVVPEVRCGAAAPTALEQAARLEQQGEARSERAPFEARELPEAVTLMREAEACYAVAQAREARARARMRAEQLHRELARRLRRTSLALELARRAERPAAVARAASALRALYGRAGPGAAPYRSWLERLARSSEAAAAQAARERK
jgi:hypothetical protein